MYCVFSKWTISPSAGPEWEARARSVRSILRATPGVKALHSIQTKDGVLVMVGYEDEATYQRIIQDASGPFARALRDTGLEEVAEWAWSERGEELDD